MERSLHFYCDLLSFEIVEKAPRGDWVLLRHGDGELMLNTAYDDGERPQNPDPVRSLGDQDRGLFIGRPDVDGAYEYLLAKGQMFQNRKLGGMG